METATIPAREVGVGSTIVDDSGHNFTVTRVDSAYGIIMVGGWNRYWGRRHGMHFAPDAPVRVRVVRDGEW